MDWLADNPGKTAILFMLIIGAVFGIAIYYESQKEGFELKKADWTCTKSENRLVVTYVLIDKMIMPITTVQNHCTQWTEK